MEQAAASRKRQNQAAPDKGGWNAFFGLVDRSLPNTNSYGNPMIRADGLAAFNGWPTSPRIEALRAAWLEAGALDEQRRICVELQMQLWQDVPYIPMGEYWQFTAYRKDPARRITRLLRGVMARAAASQAWCSAYPGITTRALSSQTIASSVRDWSRCTTPIRQYQMPI